VVNQNQMFVTDYYEIVDKLDKLLYLENENESLLLSFNNIKEPNLLNLNGESGTGPSLMGIICNQNIECTLLLNDESYKCNHTCCNVTATRWH
jgi:hypothetical protein